MSNIPDLTPDNEEILEEALQQLAAGIPLAQVLAQAGDNAAWLAPMLSAASQIKEAQYAPPLPPPDPTLQRMLAHAETIKPIKPPPAGWATRLQTLLSPSLLTSGVRTAVLAAGLLLMFFVGTIFGSGVSLAAQQSLPGDATYGLKRAFETLQLGLAMSNNHRQQLEAQFNKRRRLETELLLQQGREAEIMFEEQVLAVAPQSVTLGMTVQITNQTIIDGPLTPGARVRLLAVTDGNGQIIALNIEVLQPGAPTVTPTSTFTPSPLLTDTPPVQTGDTLTLPPTPTPTPTIPTPTPTATIQETPPEEDAAFDEQTPAAPPLDEEDELPSDDDNNNAGSPNTDDDDIEDETGDDSNDSPDDFGDDDLPVIPTDESDDDDFNDNDDSFDDNDNDDFEDNDDDFEDSDDDFEDSGDDFEDNNDDFDDNDDSFEDDFEGDEPDDNSDDDNSGSDDSNDNADDNDSEDDPDEESQDDSDDNDSDDDSDDSSSDDDD